MTYHEKYFRIAVVLIALGCWVRMGNAQPADRSAKLVLLDKATGHALTLVPPSPLVSDQQVTFPGFSSGASFVLSNSMSGQTITSRSGTALSVDGSMRVTGRMTLTSLGAGILRSDRNGILGIATGIDLPQGSGSYIQSQSAHAQSGASFWIDGSGRIDNGLSVTTGGIDLHNSGITNAGRIRGATGITSSGPVRLTGIGSGFVRTNAVGELHSDQLGESDLPAELARDAEVTAFIDKAIGGLPKQLAVIASNAEIASADLSGDVTTSGGTHTSIAKGAVTYGKMQDVGASRLLGNPSGFARSASEITLGHGLTFDSSRLAVTLKQFTTSDLAEGKHRYFTAARFDAELAERTSDDVAEGRTNLYHTAARVQGAAVGGDLTGTVANAQLAASSVGSEEIRNGSIKPEDLASSSIAITTGTGLTGNGSATLGGSYSIAIANGGITSGLIADGSIANTDVSASAAIAGSKIIPQFGTQKITSTGGAAMSGTLDLNTSGSGITNIGTSTNAGIVNIGNTTSTPRVSILAMNGRGTIGIGAAGDAKLALGNSRSKEVRIEGQSLHIESGRAGLHINSTGNVPVTFGDGDVNFGGDVIIGGRLAAGSFTLKSMVAPNLVGGVAPNSTLNLEGSNSKTPGKDRVTITSGNRIRASFNTSGIELNDNILIDGNMTFDEASIISVASAPAGADLTIRGGASDANANLGGDLVLTGGSGKRPGRVEINTITGDVSIGSAASVIAVHGITKHTMLGRGVVKSDADGYLSSSPVDLSSVDVIDLLPTAHGGTGVSTVERNQIFAGPVAGNARAPGFRALVAADLPASSGNYIQNQKLHTQANADFNIEGGGTIGSGLIVKGNTVLGDSVSDGIIIRGLVRSSINFSATGASAIGVEGSAAGGGDLNISAGHALHGSGGALTLAAGDASSAGTGGAVNIYDGVGQAGNGGEIKIIAGNTVGGYVGGSVLFAAGEVRGDGQGGETIIRGGHTGKGGMGGVVNIHGGLADKTAPGDVNINATNTGGGNINIGNGSGVLNLNTANLDISIYGGITGATGLSTTGSIVIEGSNDLRITEKGVSRSGDIEIDPGAANAVISNGAIGSSTAGGSGNQAILFAASGDNTAAGIDIYQDDENDGSLRGDRRWRILNDPLQSGTHDLVIQAEGGAQALKLTSGGSIYASSLRNGGVVKSSNEGLLTASSLRRSDLPADVVYLEELSKYVARQNSRDESIELNGEADRVLKLRNDDDTHVANLDVEGAVRASGFAGPLVGNVTGDLRGNAHTATSLKSSRKINGIAFDGSSDITITAAPRGEAHGDLSGAYPSPVVTSHNGGTPFGTMAAQHANAVAIAGGSIGGESVAVIAGATKVVAAATPLNSPNTLVSRDATGNAAFNELSSSELIVDGNTASNSLSGGFAGVAEFGASAQVLADPDHNAATEDFRIFNSRVTQNSAIIITWEGRSGAPDSFFISSRIPGIGFDIVIDGGVLPGDKINYLIVN